jgi:hypothetical protein
VFGHLSNILPVFFLRKSHDRENPIQLVVVVGVARLDVLLATVKDGLRSEQLGKDATDRPDIWKWKLNNGMQKKFEVIFVL